MRRFVCAIRSAWAFLLEGLEAVHRGGAASLIVATEISRAAVDLAAYRRGTQNASEERYSGPSACDGRFSLRV